MVRFKKIRPRRASLAVSIIVGSPIAASNRSAALAYRIGSLRHDSRYSAIDMSVWLRASNDLAKALNKESLYMIPLSTICIAARLTRVATRASKDRISVGTLGPLDTRPTHFGNARRVQP